MQVKTCIMQKLMCVETDAHNETLQIVSYTVVCMIQH